MPDETATIEAPPISPVNEGLAAVFDRALGSQMPSDQPEVPPVKEAAPPVKTEPTPPPPPEKPPVQAPAPPDSAFEPKVTEPPKVADLMPETPPEAIKTEKGKADYRKWREHQLSLEKKATELETKLRAQPLAGDTDLLAENELLKTRLAEMSSVVERADLMEHPAFRNQFIVPRQQAFETASQLLKDVDMEPGVLEKALSLSGKARIQALDELTESIESPNVRMRLVNQIDRIEQLDAARNTAMADVKGNLQRHDQQMRAERHQAMQAQVKQFGQMVDMAVESLGQTALGVLIKEIPGNDKWNESVKQSIAEARSLLTENTDAQQLAAAAVMAPLAPKAVTWAMHEREGRLAAEKELAELKAARPGLDGSGTGSGATEGVREGIAAIFDRAKEGGVFGT